MHPTARSDEAHAEATPEQLAVIDGAIARLVDLKGALLPILHAIQDELGFVPPAALPRLADALNLSRAEVHGVITFYHDFRTAPPGAHVLKVCRAEACQAMGSEQLEQHLQRARGVALGATSADRQLTAEPIYCLGNCALSPSVMLDGRVHGRVTPARLDQLLRDAERGGEA